MNVCGVLAAPLDSHGGLVFVCVLERDHPGPHCFDTLVVREVERVDVQGGLL